MDISSFQQNAPLHHTYRSVGIFSSSLVFFSTIFLPMHRKQGCKSAALPILSTTIS